MNSNSKAGPDGFNFYYFIKCWHIINDDLMELVFAFSSGRVIPNYFSHSYIAILPKLNNPKKLKEFSPISLSNVIRKMISKPLTTRFIPILPSLISLNKTGFVKGRNITEIIMLAHKINHHMKKILT